MQKTSLLLNGEVIWRASDSLLSKELHGWGESEKKHFGVLAKKKFLLYFQGDSEATLQQHPIRQRLPPFVEFVETGHSRCKTINITMEMIQETAEPEIKDDYDPVRLSNQIQCNQTWQIFAQVAKFEIFRVYLVAVGKIINSLRHFFTLKSKVALL